MDTPEAEIRHLLSQHPNPWTAGAWYPATTKAGKECQIKKTRAVGNRAPFLHIRYKGVTVLKSPTGEVLDRRPCWMNFRANLTTYELKEI